MLIHLNLKSQPRYIDPLKLTWRDYRGFVQPDSGFAAYTRSNVSMSVDTSLKSKSALQFKVTFLPDSSWVDWHALSKHSTAEVDSLFRHELLHYYISIIVFKKIKKAFKDFRFVNHHDFKKNLQEALNFYIPFAKEQQEMNIRYDFETKHGREGAKQKYWDAFISRSTDSLKNINISPAGE